MTNLTIGMRHVYNIVSPGGRPLQCPGPNPAITLDVLTGDGLN